MKEWVENLRRPSRMRWVTYSKRRILKTRNSMGMGSSRNLIMSSTILVYISSLNSIFLMAMHTMASLFSKVDELPSMLSAPLSSTSIMSCSSSREDLFSTRQWLLTKSTYD